MGDVNGLAGSFHEIISQQIENAPRMLEFFNTCSQKGCVHKNCVPDFEVYCPLDKAVDRSGKDDNYVLIKNRFQEQVDNL